ncbi:uncharacterized protein LOC133923903 [Phragmites australis]|uniref:uncharacterized protein LOC133923903 n=1 Tax=Phragmites australis TaxID=29695 RepID=UPI002D76B7B5|nr:uncharacterized protein LOC133923903 [Phragmites australis]
MATKAKASSASCLSFLKDALLLPTRNTKLFVPVFILVAVPTLLIQITNVLYIQPLTADILVHINKIKNIDPSTPEYAKLMEEIIKEARELVIISIAFQITAFVLGIAKQIVTFFAASTTYSGDRYSLPELLSKVIMKGHRLKGPLITIALVGVLEFACMALLTALIQLVMRHSAALYMALLFIFPFFVTFLYLNVVFMVTVAVSVADTERRGMSALRQAWRLMTRVKKKEGCVLVVVINLLSLAVSPLYVVALGYTKKSMEMGLVLLSVYALMFGAVELFYFTAAMVYYNQAMESKEVMAHDYVKIPTVEANV